MTQFSAIITPQSVSFTTPDGKVHNVTESHKNWVAIRDAIKQMQSSLKWDAENADAIFREDAINPHGDPEDCHTSLAELIAPPTKHIIEAGAGRVTVVAGVVYYEDEAVHSAVTERIIQGLSEGFDMTAYMLFLDNAMENPSARAVDEMYSFMEKNNMGITADGYILGYKKVLKNFHDIYTGKIDNSPGEVVKMKRNKVDDDGRRTCSKGLHFCSMSYLPHYGCGPGDKIVIVKVNPRDIVSVPIDYNHAKVRCCEYLVLSEYTGDDKEDLLGTKAVWSDDDFDDEDEFGDDDWDSEEDDYSAADEPELSHDEDAEIERLAAYDAKRMAEAEAESKAAATKSGNAAMSPFDIARFYHGEEQLAPEPAPVDEIPDAFLSEEGEDMRQIMDTVEAPHTEEGDAMRALIDVVEAADDLPADEALTAAVSVETEDAVRKAFDRLVTEITKAAKKN